MNRRDFFAVLGGGVVVVMLVEDEIYAQETGGGRAAARVSGLRSSSAPGCTSAKTGIVTVYSGKVEVGQNARTSLTQAVAEELHAPVASIRMVMGDTELTPLRYRHRRQQTTPQMWPQIRQAAAAAREILVDLAAQKWTVDRGTMSVRTAESLRAATRPASAN